MEYRLPPNFWDGTTELIYIIEMVKQ